MGRPEGSHLRLRKGTFTQGQEHRAKPQRFELQKAVAIAFGLATGLGKNGLAYYFWTFGVVTPK